MTLQIQRDSTTATESWWFAAFQCRYHHNWSAVVPVKVPAGYPLRHIMAKAREALNSEKTSTWDLVDIWEPDPDELTRYWMGQEPDPSSFF